MRRADRAVRRGTSLQGSDRTAGDSSPVTQINGRLRGRPGPAGGTERRTRPDQRVADVRFVQHHACQAPPPPDRQRSRPDGRPLRAGAHDDASRRTDGTRPPQAAHSPGASSKSTGALDVGADRRGAPRPRVAGPLSSDGNCDAGHTENPSAGAQPFTASPCHISRRRRTCARRGVQVLSSLSPLLPALFGGAGVQGFFGGTGGIPRNGSRRAPKASAGTAGRRGSTGRRRS